ncbi:MAG: glycosyltransferase family 4 protein [Nanoarchaeota archaeon]|nr:glycosyltransferase family 4 protein [Nanoarchaeota archaeon]
MKKIDVNLICGPHPLFKEIINYPPKNVKYHVSLIPNTTYNDIFTRYVKKAITKAQGILQIPRMMHSRTDSDLIHSTRGVLMTNKKPWVVDVEMAGSFVGLMNWNSLRKPLTRYLISKYLSSPWCRKILPYSYAAKKNIEDWIDCKKFRYKIEVVHPAYHSTKVKRRQSDQVTFSFICRTSPIDLDFYIKGGHDLLRAFQILNKKYDNIHLKIKGSIPKHLQKNLKNVTFTEENLPREKFYEEFLLKPDVYVQPTLVDTFAIAVIEAMSVGLPVVATNMFAMPEIIREGYNGFLINSKMHWDKYVKFDPKYEKFNIDAAKIHPEMVKDLVKKLSILIEDKNLRRKMGQNSFEMVDSGKFSIKRRNEKLRKIYEEALR